MSTGYQIKDQTAMHYLTFQVVGCNKNGLKTENLSLGILCAVRRPQLNTAKSETFAYYAEQGPVLLNGGETQLFNGSDLARYFDPANLIFRGYSEAQYRKTSRLPEGAYRLTVDVVDYNRNVTVSKSLAAGQMFIFENEPPLLNFPMKDELLSALMPQNILFSWTPRQNPYSSPTFVPEYKFELWEIWPEDKNPNEIVRSTEPIYTVNVQTPSFLYTVNEPLLFTGRQYVWRIQVLDPEGIVQFKQNGYSEIRLFRFGKFCPVPEPAIEKVGPAHIALKWEGDSRITKYDVRYRIKKSKNREWYAKSTPFLGVDIDNLKANTAYEFQVCAYCDDQPGEYSPILTASTKEETKFQCGATPPNPLLDNTNPLDKLGPRDIIRAGDFDVMVASASGSGGNFSGKGWVLVPYLKFIRIEVEFSNISVNDEYRLTAGEIKTVYNIDNAMVARVGDISFLFSDNPKAVEDNDFVKVTNHVYRPDSTITDITISNGVVTITTDNGEKIQVRAENKGIVAVAPQDETSTQYVADTKTNTVYTGTPETNTGNASATNAVPQPKQANTQYKVEFLAHPQEEAGTDYPNDKRPAANYETIQLDGKAVLVPWKSMEASKYDRLVAKISGGPADTVRYRRQSEVMVMTAPMSNDVGDNLYKGAAASGYKQLLLSSLGQMDEDKLYAWYPEYETMSDTTKRQNRVLAGQMNLASYDKLALNVYLVSVNGSALPKVNDVQNALNAIYKPAVVTWTVNLFGDLDVILKNGKSRVLDISDLTGNMEYSLEMNKVIAALKKKSGYSGKDYYVFFFDGFIPPAGKNPDGYMPFNRDFGFLKTTNSKTIAHELGHGAFRLRHPFSPDCPYPQAEGTTDNLMDYTSDNNATALLKYQWDEVHDRDLGVNLGVDAEEGEEVRYSDIYEIVDNTAFATTYKLACHTFFTPAGFPITFDESSQIEISDLSFKSQTEDNINVPEGALFKFKLNHVKYRACYQKNKETGEYVFIGYRNDETSEFYSESFTQKLISPYKINVFNAFAGKVEQKDCYWDINLPCLNITKKPYQGKGYVTKNIEYRAFESVFTSYSNILSKNTVLSRAIKENPCIMSYPKTLHFGGYTPESQWMKEFNMTFGGLLNVGISAPIAIEFFIAPTLEAIVPTIIDEGSTFISYFTKERAKNVVAGVALDLALQAWILNTFEDVPIKEIPSKIEYDQTFITALESAVDLPAVSTFVAPLYGAFVQNGKIKSDLTFEEVYKNYVVGASVNCVVCVASSHSVKWFSALKHNMIKLRIVFKKLGREAFAAKLKTQPIVEAIQSVAQRDDLGNLIKEEKDKIVDGICDFIESYGDAGDLHNVADQLNKTDEIVVESVAKRVIKTKDELINLVDEALKSYLKSDLNESSKLFEFLKSNPNKLEAWKVLHKSFHSTNIKAINYVDRLKSNVKLGIATSTDYLTTWRNEFPSLQGGGFNVHHSIEQQVLTKYPGLFDELEINSLENLRGISGEINPDIHLSRIRKEWDKFYDEFPAGTMPTRKQVLDYAKHVDDLFGKYFSPQIRIE